MSHLYTCMWALPVSPLFFNKKGAKLNPTKLSASVPERRRLPLDFFGSSTFYMPKSGLVGVWSHCQMEEKKADENLIWLQQSRKWQPNDFVSVSPAVCCFIKASCVPPACALTTFLLQCGIMRCINAPANNVTHYHNYILRSKTFGLEPFSTRKLLASAFFCLCLCVYICFAWT
jgi:hypothetical protein